MFVNLKPRKNYPNGYPMPLLRGWIHLLFSIISGSILLRMSHLIPCEKFYLLLFDFTYITNSSIYHNYDSLNHKHIKHILTLDYCFIMLRELIYTLYLQGKVMDIPIKFLHIQIGITVFGIIYNLKYHIQKFFLDEVDYNDDKSHQVLIIFIIGLFPFVLIFLGFGFIINPYYITFYIINEIVACMIFYFELFKYYGLFNFHDVFHLQSTITTLSLYFL
jgi:hypothetical protein